MKASDHDLGTQIYVDSQLGPLRGEFESEKIFEMGFRKIYMGTGYSKDHIKKPDWIMDILPKSPERIFG